MYIEDDPSSQDVMHEVCARIPDVELVVCGTARGGIQTFIECKERLEGGVNLLIIDGELPDANGWEVVTALRFSFSMLPPILAYVGDLGGGRQERWKEAGVNEFLQKPVDLAVLMDTIRRLLNAAPTPHAG